MNSSHKTSIQLLPEHIIDQIKAGEVIERPSTLIKEILENSIDAGADKIALHIIDNGLVLISLKDNGKGIASHELPLAFCRHATSKIDRFEDIYHLNSYGFRGEALASIASISKITCESNTLETSGLIKIEGGNTLIHQESKKTAPPGTEMYIKDLFYNTPVRMKFIQSKTSEKNQLQKIINSFLIANPQIEFSLKWDDSEKNIFQKKDAIVRIQEVLFKTRKVEFVNAKTDYDGVKFEIFLSKEASRGNAHKHHFLYVNNRYIQDIQIHKIILNSAKQFWLEHETGHYIAHLSIPNDEIDVNVHPNKTVIKFFQASKIYALISGTIKSKVLLPEVSEKFATSSLSGENTFIPDLKFKNIDYKKINFDQIDEVENYFKNIHTENHNFHGPKASSIIHFENFMLLLQDEVIFCINKIKLVQNNLNEIFSKLNKNSENIPLLVSRPILLEKKMSSGCELFIKSLGFDIDFLEQKTLVLRSFPKSLQHLPYLNILEHIIKLEPKSLADIKFNNIDIRQIPNSVLERMSSHLAQNTQLSEIIFPINNNDLQRLYDSKK